MWYARPSYVPLLFVPIPAVRPSTGSHSAYCARLAESLVPKNPQLQSAAGRRIGHSRLSRSTHNSRERTSISFGVVVGSLSSVSLRTLYRVNRKRCSQILDFQNFESSLVRLMPLIILSREVRHDYEANRRRFSLHRRGEWTRIEPGCRRSIHCR